MSNVSAVILTKNEEQMIADCIDSVGFCDEILVVDNGSKDNTKKIAKQHKAKIIDGKNLDFSHLRNLGKEEAKGEWILYIDADERVTKELAEEIINTINRDDAYDAYKILRKNFYLGAFEWPYKEKLERLFKKHALQYWFGELHETPHIQGAIGQLQGLLYHYSHQNLSLMIDKTNKWSDIEAKLRFDARHPQMTWWRFPRVMLTAFCDFYFKQGGWKVGTAGVIESVYQAFSMFITYAKLWELQQKNLQKKEER